MGKYTALGDLHAEKMRQERMEALGIRVVRWTWDDIRRPNAARMTARPTPNCTDSALPDGFVTGLCLLRAVTGRRRSRVSLRTVGEGVADDGMGLSLRDGRRNSWKFSGATCSQASSFR